MLPISFYRRDTLTVASELLGCYLVHVIGRNRIVGRIVETEAYLCNDPACHASRGRTKRNEVMFRAGGCAYVYFIYGMHYCFNVVTGKEGQGEAVLIRALEPVEGVERMQAIRNKPLHQLCNGPAKLVEALGISKAHNGVSLVSKELHLLPSSQYGTRFSPVVSNEIVTTTRIGISQGAELKYRFYLRDNSFISRK